MSKATVSAPSNIAFIKYWGARDLERVIPTNASISMTLDSCTSRSTVEHLPGEDGAHEILWRAAAGSLETPPPAFAERVERHLDRLRDWAGCGGRFRFATENTFPSAAGIASSASGFAALTLGVLAALGRDLSDEERSDLTRRGGSGSATRSVLGGYVQWPAEIDWDDDGTALPARQLYAASHWDLRDVVALVETGPKATSSLDGHRLAGTSIHFETRLQNLPKRLREVRDALASKDIEKLGTVVEAEAIDLHCMAMTSHPAIFYWQPGTLTVLAEVRAMREDGLAAYSTMDAGANVHVICLPEHEPQVAERLAALDCVQGVLRDRVGDGPAVLDEHLF